MGCSCVVGLQWGDEAKGKIVPIRFNAEDLKKVTSAAKANKQTVSEWVRSTLYAKLEV